MRVNNPVSYPVPRTAEGAPAARITAEQELRRLSACCMLWEDGFYVDGKTIAERIRELVALVSPEFAAAVAYEARTRQKLRHLPLWVAREMARLPAHKHLVGRLLPDIIQRPDEITEFLALYWKDDPKGKRSPVSSQVKKGLAAAFAKFDEYRLAKYDRDGAVKLRDALFLSHARPSDARPGFALNTRVQRRLERDGGAALERSPGEELFQRVAERKLATPDTWEVALSAGADKAGTFERLMAEGALGGLAFLRNMRNMRDAGVPKDMVAHYATTAKLDRILPFRFIAAARAVPEWEDIIEPMMLRALAERPVFPGRTILLIDASGSMSSKVSGKSDISRLDAACGVAIFLRELADYIDVFTFSDDVRMVPPRRGFALRDAIGHPRGGTRLGAAVRAVSEQGHDRLIVITDEQSQDAVPNPVRTGYMVNVASERNGVGYGAWRRVDGWSEAVIDYIQHLEADEAAVGALEVA